MAIYHLTAQFISRGDGRSAVAAAAYRHGAEMYFEREGKQFSFTMKEEVVYNEILLPDQTPSWLRDAVDGRDVVGASEALWNAVENHFSRSNAQLARDIECALPRELSRDQNIALANEFLKRFTDKGHVVTWAYHEKDGNPHFHAMMTLAPMTEEGFGKTQVPVCDEHGERVYVTRKNGKRQAVSRPWAGEFGTQLELDREAWAEHVNRHLKEHGFKDRVTHLSHEARGIDDIEPQIHLGPSHGFKERGHTNDRIEEYAAIQARNLAIVQKNPDRILELITDQKSVFDRADIAKALHGFVDDNETFQRLQAKVENSASLVPIRAGVTDPMSGRRVEREHFTTREMLSLESDMMDRARRMADGSTTAVSARRVDKALQAREFLSDEQVNAVRYVTDEKRLACVVGLAGAGKTTMLETAREAWEAQGLKVHGATIAGKAAQELEQSSGIQSRTLASLEWSLNNDKFKLGKNDVLVIDEAGMVGSKQLARVMQHAETAGAKMVMVGDPDQLQPIAAGGAFRAVLERTGYAEINTIRRQNVEWQKEASQAFARGDVGEGLEAYREKGNSHAYRLKEDAVRSMARRVCDDREAGKSVLALAHTNKDVQAVNAAVRDERKERGDLEDGAQFKTSRGSIEVSQGDRIVFLQNDRELGVKNGMLGDVIEAGKDSLKVQTEAGETVKFTADRYNSVGHGYCTTIHKSQGATVDRTHVLATRGLDRNLTYVAMTRHREDCHIHYGDRSFPAKDGGMEAYLGRHEEKSVSVDYLAAIDYGDRRGHDTFKALKSGFNAIVEGGAEKMRQGIQWLFRERAEARESEGDEPVKQDYAKANYGPTWDADRAKALAEHAVEQAGDIQDEVKAREAADKLMAQMSDELMKDDDGPNRAAALLQQAFDDTQTARQTDGPSLDEPEKDQAERGEEETEEDKGKPPIDSMSRDPHDETFIVRVEDGKLQGEDGRIVDPTPSLLADAMNAPSILTEDFLHRGPDQGEILERSERGEAFQRMQDFFEGPEADFPDADPDFTPPSQDRDLEP
ncbi:MAG: Ti-type conjugative transfer relaxase TraA [Pseudomonadota bacterium]